MPGRARDRGRRAASGARPTVRTRPSIVVLGGSVVVLVPTIMRMSMSVVAGILVMPECHALPRDDRCQALARDCEAEGEDCEQPEKRPTHRRRFYALFERIERFGSMAGVESRGCERSGFISHRTG
jgi:hypothetical protein